MKPIIGLVPLVDEDKDSLWMLPGYMDGVTAAGGIPIMLPLTSDKDVISQLLSHVQGVLLTGGHDVDPKIYDEDPVDKCGTPSRERDEMESEVLRQALNADKAILGICRGIQFLNAYLGGTLYQDLTTQHPSDTEHHQSPPYNVPVHQVSIVNGSGLHRLLGTDTLRVNSYHHQAIKQKADNLKTMAVSQDGLIEAVELSDRRFVWAVQWHPEFSFRSDRSSQKIFEEFVRNCSAC